MLRLVFIFAGAQLLQTFFWTAYVFGAFLIYTAYKMAFQHGAEVAPERNIVVRIVRRVVPTDPAYHGARFFTRIDGRRVATLLFVALVAVEATDLIFAIDSVAAILAITTSTFIVWTANAFAVLGLRSLYFCLAGLLRRFTHATNAAGQDPRQDETGGHRDVSSTYGGIPAEPRQPDHDRDPAGPPAGRAGRGAG